MQPFQLYVLWGFYVALYIFMLLIVYSTEINEFHQNSQLLFLKKPFKIVYYFDYGNIKFPISRE